VSRDTLALVDDLCDHTFLLVRAFDSCVFFYPDEELSVAKIVRLTTHVGKNLFAIKIEIPILVVGHKNSPNPWACGRPVLQAITSAFSFDLLFEKIKMIDVAVVHCCRPLSRGRGTPHTNHPLTGLNICRWEGDNPCVALCV